MRERAGQILKIASYVLAALVLYQLVHVVLRVNPLARVKIPALPTLSTNAATTNAPATASVKSTNAPAIANSPQTNVPSVPSVVSVPVPRTETNQAAPPPMVVVESSTNLSPAQAAKMQALMARATNNSAVRTTNATRGPGGAPGPEVMMAGMNSRSMPGGRPAPAPPLSPEIKARVDRIVESEILGQVVRPMPMALLGIAGDVAFLRTPSGQTGMVKTGSELGGIKLLRIGINRVLVEEQGQQKELIIFNGYGGDSLLSKQKDTPDEINHP